MRTVLVAKVDQGNHVLLVVKVDPGFTLSCISNSGWIKYQ